MELNPGIYNCECLIVWPVLLSGLNSLCLPCVLSTECIILESFVLPVNPNKSQWNYRRLLVWFSLLSPDDHWQQSADSI